MNKELKDRRQILIETDGTDIWVVKKEATDLELVAIFQKLLNQLIN